MIASTSPLGAVRLESIHGYPDRDAGMATIAIRPIGDPPAAAETVPDEFAVNVGVDQVARGRDLRPSDPFRKVTAWVRGGRVELKRRQREVVELGHANRSEADAGSQGPSGAAECTNAATSSANARRAIGRAPNDARCAVCC